ncbi:MAG: glycosyltransferase family 39 protein [Rhodomicrobium sp.]
MDEAFYLVVGCQWLNGLPPYAGSFDVKPPLLFLLMAGAEALFGPALWAAKALAIAAAAFTACGLYLFGRRFIGELAGAAASLLYLISVLNLGGTFSPAELIMAPFTTFGMLIGAAALLDQARSNVPAFLASGLLYGAAACVKQTALFEAAPWALALVTGNRARPPWGAFAVFAAGICIVPGGFALYFGAIGHLKELIQDVVFSAIGRASVGYIAWSVAFRLLLTGLLPILPIIAMAGIGWVERRSLQRDPVCRVLPILGAWTGGALIGILATRAMFVIYCIPLLQPLSLLAGTFVQRILGRIASPARRLLWRIGVLAICVAYSGWAVAPLLFEGRGNVKAAEAAAALIRHSGGLASDPILVVDRDMLVYIAAHAEPPTGIFHPQQLLCPFPFKGAWHALSDSISRNPVFVVVSNSPVVRVCEEPHKRAALESTLARDYCTLGEFESSVTGWPGAFTVYGLKTRVSGSCLR